MVSLPIPELTAPTCSVTRTDGHVVVAVVGAVDRTTVACIRSRLLHEAKEQPARLTVDLDHAALVDGTGPAMLAELWHFAREHGIDLAVRSTAASLRQVFDVAPGGRLRAIRS